MSEAIIIDVMQGVMTITLDRPDKMNSFTAQMSQELIAAFDDADADDDVRAVIVTGSGRAFCAGADLGLGAATFDYASRSGAGTPVNADGSIDYAHPAVRDEGGLVTLRIFRCLKPVIAAINGAAVGFGATLTLPMDIRLASTEARIGFVFARRGIVPESASSWFLPRLVGMSRALEWCLTGRVMTADEALAGGLVRSLHAPETLLDAAQKLAREIADNTSSVSVALTRQMLWRGLGQMHPMEAHRLDSKLVYARGRSQDAAEGVASFLEKRVAVYPDRVASDMPHIYPWFDEPEWG